MASTTSNNANHNFILSPHQQNLLFAALNSNKIPEFGGLDGQSTDPSTIAPLAFDNSPLQQTPVSGTLNGFEDSPYIDYDYNFEGDGDFGDYDLSNLSQGQMIGNLPGTASSEGDADGVADGGDKRSHPDDEDNEEDGGGKRREGEDKQTKKPGRKPLTSEPTSKRKAQNRAAQRAFRERKEKHLKDLETKVSDLEKASEAANHENALLRAQIEKMSVELKEYRKRLTTNGNTARAATINGALPSYLAGRGLNANAANNPNDVNFQFEFPKFGRLPGPPVLNASPQSITGSTTASPPTQSPRGSNAANGTISPLEKTLQNSFNSSKTNVAQTNNSNNGAADVSNFSGLFNPSSLDAVTKDNVFDFVPKLSSTSTASRTSFDSANQSTSGRNTSHSSPASSSSNNGLTSSCGTSPEPASQSPPAFKADNTLGTIGEEKNNTSTIQGEASFCEKLSMACGNPNNPVPRTMSKSGVSPGALQTPGFDINGIDWLAQQNNNQFDPQLFGDYRESQDNILSTGFYDDAFFNEAFAMPDFSSPFALEASPGPKKDLVQEIDAKLNEEDEVVPGEAQMLTCTNMWEKIQACPRVQNGEIDMDSLCSQLQAKAKCSGDGPVIQESDFKEVLHSMFKENPAAAVAAAASS